MSEDRRVLVGVKGGDTPEAALRVGATEARARSGRMTLVYVIMPPTSGYLGYLPSLNEVGRAARHELDQVVAEARSSHPDLEIDGQVVLGRAADVLIAESRRAALLVVGSRMRGAASSILLGSVGCGVAAGSACPVIVVRGAAREISRVVVGTDQSDDGRAAVRFALEEASRRSVPLRVVSTWELPSVGYGIYWMIRLSNNDLQRAAEKELEDSLTAERTTFPDVDIETVVEQGDAAATLLDQATDTSMLVVGSRGHGRVTGLLLGSVSQALLHHAPCPVAVVHRQPDKGAEMSSTSAFERTIRRQADQRGDA